MVGVPVETRSGSPIGKVASFDFEQATGRLFNMNVHTRSLGLAKDLIIPWDAVLEITPKKVIIADGEAPAGSRHVFRPASPMDPVPTLLKDSS